MCSREEAKVKLKVSLNKKQYIIISELQSHNQQNTIHKLKQFINNAIFLMMRIFIIIRSFLYYVLYLTFEFLYHFSIPLEKKNEYFNYILSVECMLVSYNVSGKNIITPSTQCFNSSIHPCWACNINTLKFKLVWVFYASLQYIKTCPLQHTF